MAVATAVPADNEDDDTIAANAALEGDIEVVVDETTEEETTEEETTAEETTEEETTTEETPEEETTEEEPHSAGDELDDPDDAEFTSFPAKVQKRIMRERRLARRERAEKDKLAHERTQIIPAVQKLVAEKAAVEDEAFGLREAYVKLLDDSLGREIEATLRELTAAKADGKDDDEIKAMSRLQELNARRVQAQDLVQQLERAKAGRPSAEDRKKQAETAAAAAAATRTAPVNPLTQRWLGRNKAWFSKPQFAAESAAARALDTQLAQEGYDPATAEFFTEWDRRIDRKFPTLRKKGKPVDKPAVKKTPVAAPSQVAGGGSAAPSNRRQMRLGPGDIEMIKGMKLDPTDPAVLQEFARVKMRRLIEEGKMK
jgi:hypothetical protein